MTDVLLRFSLLVPFSRLPLFSTLSVSPLPKLAHNPTSDATTAACTLAFRLQPKRLLRFKMQAADAQTDEQKWWEKNAGPNMVDIHSTEEFLNVLSQAGDKLVIVEFYGTWCGSCRALFPKLCKTAQEHPDILFLKVNFDENKPMCKRLSVRVLPYFHFYRGADGRLESFSCSLAKFQKIKDAIATHNTARCSIGPPLGVGNLDLLQAWDKPAEAGSVSSISSESYLGWCLSFNSCCIYCHPINLHQSLHILTAFFEIVFTAQIVSDNRTPG